MDKRFEDFDSGKYNEICMSYVRNAVENLKDEGILDDSQAKAVTNEVSYLFDIRKSKEVFDEF